jgi:uncharacterized protein (DUF1684 family)
MLDRRLFLCSSIATAAASAAAGDLAAEHEAWRRERLERLTGDEGWLTVSGLHWLEPGANRIPTAPGLVFTLRGQSVMFESSQPVLVNGQPARKRKLRKDADKIALGERTFFAIVRGDRVAIRERDKQSRFRTGFKGLELFRFRPELHFAARWIQYPKPVKRRITTVANTVEEMMAPGQAEFTFAGTTYRLEPVVEEDHLFYIFKDLTAGKTTYAAGRFMELPMPKNGIAIVDFNRAYNPPCAFTPYATCPLPLKQNQLPVAIEAGEMAYHLE